MRKMLSASVMLAFAVSAHAQTASPDDQHRDWRPWRHEHPQDHRSTAATNSASVIGPTTAAAAPALSDDTASTSTVAPAPAATAAATSAPASSIGSNTTSPVTTTAATAAATPSTTPVTTAATSTTGTCSIAATSGNFAVKNGQIIGPNGQPFIAHGINVYDSDMGEVQQILGTFQGLNFVRLNAYSYQVPSAYQAFIRAMTSQGIVVEIEDHTNDAGNAGGGQGSAFTGAQLLTEGGWYSQLASAYASNPYVWFGTDNEPPAAGISSWQESTYNSIRSAGSNAIILMELPGGGPTTTGMTPSTYSGMTNIAIDAHFYGWVVNDSTDPGTVSAGLNDEVAAAQTITSADGTVPVIIGEYGPSTTGQSMDANGMQVVAAVTGSGLGSAAWNLDSEDCCNNLTTSPSATSLTSPYGQTVAQFIASMSAAVTTPSVAAPTTNSCALSETLANAAAVDDALTEAQQSGASNIIVSLNPSVAPAQPTPPSTTVVAQTTAPTATPLSAAPLTAPQTTPGAAAAAATSTQSYQQQAADNLQQTDAIAETVNSSAVQAQVKALTAKAQAEVAAANAGNNNETLGAPQP
jgi:Cellulase (glycosyl hydrolase family 5)